MAHALAACKRFRTVGKEPTHQLPTLPSHALTKSLIFESSGRLLVRPTGAGRGLGAVSCGELRGTWRRR